MIEHIAIIGLGSIGQKHLELVRELRPEIRITVVRSGKGKSIDKEKIADDISFSLEKTIDTGVQAAIIASPAIQHINESLKLIKSGIHILVEKPLSHNLTNIDKLLKIGYQSDIVSLVGYCLRHDPAAIRYKEILRSNKIGDILHVSVDCGSFLPDWRPNQNYRETVSAKKDLGGGALLELSHEFHYINWFFGNMKSVYANINNSGKLDIDVEDSADLIFESEKGFTILMHLDFNSSFARRNCTAHCTNGDFIWDAVPNRIICRTDGNQEEIESFNYDKNKIYREQLKHFFKCIEYNDIPKVSLHDGAMVIKMVEAAKESYETGKRVLL